MGVELTARREGRNTKPWLIGGGIVCALALVATLLVVLLESPDASVFARLRPLDPRVEVRATGEGDYALGSTGQELRVGDTVRTDPEGRGEIAYHEGSLTRLGPDAVFELTELTNAPALHLRLEVGQLWQRVARLTGTEGSFRLHTPAATATVAGTVFAVDCTEDGACTFTVVEGAVHLVTTMGGELTLEAGEQVTIDPGGTPGETRTLSEDDVWADEWIAYNLEGDGEMSPPAPEPTRQPEPSPAQSSPAARGADSPEQAARELLAAWGAGDQRRASRVANPPALQVLFDDPYGRDYWRSTQEIRSCYEADWVSGSPTMCEFGDFDSGGDMHMVNTEGRWFVDEVQLND